MTFLVYDLIALSFYDPVFTFIISRQFHLIQRKQRPLGDIFFNSSSFFYWFSDICCCKGRYLYLVCHRHLRAILFCVAQLSDRRRNNRLRRSTKVSCKNNSKKYLQKNISTWVQNIRFRNFGTYTKINVPQFCKEMFQG